MGLILSRYHCIFKKNLAKRLWKAEQKCHLKTWPKARSLELESAKMKGCAHLQTELGPRYVHLTVEQGDRIPSTSRLVPTKAFSGSKGNHKHRLWHSIVEACDHPIVWPEQDCVQVESYVLPEEHKLSLWLILSSPEAARQKKACLSALRDPRVQ